MSDIGGIKNALTGLSALLPRVPESLAALAEAQAALSEAAEQFLATVEARQVEAAELFPRLEIALTGLSREAADGTAQAEQDRDLQERLQDPDLSFDERVSHFTTLLGEKQEQRIRHMARALGTAAENAATLQSGRQSLHEGLLDGRKRVAAGADVALGAAQGLQAVVEAARGTIGTDVEQVGAEMDGQHTAQARELEALRRDVEAYEANYVERIDRVREVVRQDTDLMLANLRDRLEDVGSTLGRALTNLRDGLQDLDERLREATEEAAEGRQSLQPQFEDLENLLPQLRQQIAHVREAAAMVGIPF